jgi:DDE superfamily endonuclease/Helix-turn-helix of DDE superfamily endonuclease
LSLSSFHEEIESELSSDDSSDDSGSDYDPTSSSDDSIPILKKEKFVATQTEHTIRAMKARPRTYTGVPEYSWFMIENLWKISGLEYFHILIVLRKLRLNEPIEVIGDLFEVSVSQCSRIFIQTLLVLHKFFKRTIFWPDVESIKKNLPINFRRRYSNVQSIIDCFEVRIQKPSEAVSQAQSWSEYKSGNTVKYLISCTPCGMINFISKG